MITCEWHPGQDPTTAPFEVAVKGVVDKADIAELKRQFENHLYVDQIEVYRDRVVSTKNNYVYQPVITKMTHGWGKACDRITMKKWKAADMQGALVYMVNGHAWAYAAVCRNWFTLPAVAVPALARPAVMVPEVPVEEESGDTVASPPQNFWLKSTPIPDTIPAPAPPAVVAWPLLNLSPGFPFEKKPDVPADHPAPLPTPEVIHSVPEASSFWLTALALLGLYWHRKRFHQL